MIFRTLIGHIIIYQIVFVLESLEKIYFVPSDEVEGTNFPNNTLLTIKYLHIHLDKN